MNGFIIGFALSFIYIGFKNILALNDLEKKILSSKRL